MMANLDQEAEKAAALLRAGRAAEAEDLLTRILQADDRHVEALQLFGVLKQRSGDLLSAERYLRQAIDIDPLFWPPRVNLAALYLSTNNPDKALPEAKTAAELAPSQAICWQHLAGAAERTGDFSTASLASEQVAKLGAADAVAEMRGALHAILARRLEAAHGAIGRARQKNAPQVQLFAIEAQLAALEGRWADLREIARNWMTISPQDRTARETASRAELELGNIGEAADLFRPLMEGQGEIGSNDALTYGRICLNALRFDEAARYLGAAVEAMPANADALTALARLRTFEGELDEARSLLDRAIASAPDNPRPFLQLAVTTRGGFDDDALSQMKALLENGVADQASAAGLAFAIGDGLFRRGEAQDSLNYYQRGNEQRRKEGEARGYIYDPRIMEADVRLLEEAAPFLNQLTLEVPTAGPTPIFITGMPRSGTTLVERILASHGEVCAGGERSPGPRLLESFIFRARRDGAEAAAQWVGREAAALQQQYLDGTADVETRFLTDKMPGNALGFPLFAALFPQARFLLMRRRAFDVAVSVFRHQFPFPYSWAHRFEDIAHYAPVFMGASARMALDLDGRAANIDYDALASDPEARIPELVARAGLDWDSACREASATGRPIATFSSVQVRAEISPKSSDGGGLFRSLMEQYADRLDTAVEAAMGPQD